MLVWFLGAIIHDTHIKTMNVLPSAQENNTHITATEMYFLLKKADEIHHTSVKNAKKIVHVIKHPGEQNDLKQICILKNGIYPSKIDFTYNQETKKYNYSAMSFVGLDNKQGKNRAKKIKVLVSSDGIHFSLAKEPQKIIYSHRPVDLVTYHPSTIEVITLKNNIVVLGSDGAYCDPKPKGYVYFIPTFEQYLEKKPKTVLEKIWLALSMSEETQTTM